MQKEDETYGKWLDGKHINRYVQNWGGEWLKYGNWLGAPREKRFFEGERILFREIPTSDKRIIACFVDETFYHGHSISPFKPFNDAIFDLKFLVGVLNSKLISFYGQKKLPNFGKDIFPKINPSDIKEIPIAISSKTEQAPIIKLVEQILTAKQSTPSVSTAEMERAIDKIVYGLYGLTGDEIEIIENSIR